MIAALRPFLLPAAGVLFAGVTAGLALLYLLQRTILFPAPAPDRAGPTIEAFGGERVWLVHEGGRSEAWYLPAAPGRAIPAALIIFAHGNAELIEYWGDNWDDVRRWGLSVLLVEYPGYGRSEGAPSERSISAAMVAAFDWAAARPDVDSKRIVAWGRSLGGGAACALARKRPVAALILESTFSSVRRMARSRGLPGFLVRDPFDNLAALRDFPGPVLLIHGENDDIIPPGHARALYAAARSAELHLLPCGHNDCPQPWAVIQRFLKPKP